MSVRIRMKKMGRAHRHFFRICATDKRAPRDGKVLEEIGTYDPMIADPDARAILKKDRVDYWLSVGAQPSDKCAVLIKKYGSGGTHESAQQSALERLAMPTDIPDPGEAAAPAKAEEKTSAADAPAAEEKAEEKAEAPAEEAAAAEEAKPEEPKPEEPQEEAAAEEPAKSE